MTIEDFLEILEQRDLVPMAIVKQVRTKVEKGDRRITPKSLLKYLVKKELITKPQAKQLLATTLTVTPHAESSILGMAATPQVPASSKRQPPFEEIPTIEPVGEPVNVEDSGSLVTDEEDSPSEGFADRPSSLLSESLSRIGVGDPTLQEALQEGSSEADPIQPGRTKKKGKKQKKDEWDSSLLLLGGGGLALLIVTGIIIGILLLREDADAILSEAGEFFDGGSYTQAIKQYERFVENHPSHPDFSAGKVKLGLARLWKSSSGTHNFNEALNTTQQVLSDIEDEEQFNTAQRDLASLLPKIAQGLANQAEKATAQEKAETLVQKSKTALSLCTNTKYIPKTFRDEVLLDEIRQTLDRVERSQAQNAALATALAEMQTAIDARDTARAYQVYDSLLDEHPGLLQSEPLAAKILEISTAEAAVVKYVAESQTAATQPRPSRIVAELALANRTGKAVADVEGTVAVRVSGAVYGLSAQDGTLRWRRFVGMAPQLPPVELPTGDFLVVDAQHQELLKLSGQNGKLLWRQPFETAVSQPVLLRNKILITESAGKLHVLDVASGQRDGYVQFAQRLSTPPTVGSGGRRIYLTGEHSSLYTLSAEDFSCLGVFFLNHAKGSVAIAPAKVLNKLIVVVAKGLTTSRLEVLNLTENGLPEQRVTSRRLEGLVNTKLLVARRRLVAVTSQGQVIVYEIGAGTGKDALTQIASRDAVGGPPMARFGLLHQGQVWVAGPKLNKLNILPTSDRLPVGNLDEDYLGDTFDHPLQKVGRLLIHVRRPAGQAGVMVAAMEMQTGQPRWEIELATPPAGPPAADAAGMQISALTASGSAYLVDRQAMSRRVLNRAEQPAALRQLPPLGESLDLGAGRLATSATEGKVLLHFRPDLPRGSLKLIRLVGTASCDPVAWDTGFVVPTQTGQVYYYNSEDGQPWGSPYQPPLEPGMRYSWQAPAVYGSGAEAKLVISDGREKVYLLSRATNPQPHLTAETKVDISTSPFNTRLAVVGDIALSGTEAGSLAVFRLPTLAAAPLTELQAQITWGPFTVNDQVVLATATEELVCLDNQAQIVWRKALAHGPPTGRPLELEGDLVLLWQQGGLSRVNFTNGQEDAFVELPQPVVAGPVVFGKRLLVSSYDGTLLVVDHP